MTAGHAHFTRFYAIRVSKDCPGHPDLTALGSGLIVNRKSDFLLNSHPIAVNLRAAACGLPNNSIWSCGLSEVTSRLETISESLPMGPGRVLSTYRYIYMVGWLVGW